MTLITISRQLGSGGDAIAAEVASHLGLRLVDRETVHALALAAGVPEDLLVRLMYEGQRSLAAEILDSLATKVRMYVCGPTVYDDAHVGHAMSSIVFDFVRRYLEYKGYQVRHVMNFTDVDDKIIARANKLNEDPAALAHRYVERYQDHWSS
jgi:hypothetical protein